MNLAQFRNLIGDYNAPGDETEEVGVGDSNYMNRKTFYLDDIAKFMHENDFMLEDAFPSVQTIDVYTVGFTTNATANALLKKTAQAGGGEFFFSNNPEELAQGLASTIASISAKARAFTAATVPASRATDGNNFFTSYFMPSESPFWQGHLKLFEFNARGEIRDEPVSEGVPGECALADPGAPASCREGALKLILEGYWDATNEIPAEAARKLYVSKYQTDPPAQIGELPPEFKTDIIGASDLGVNGATSTDIAAYDLSFPGFDTAGITTDEELADAIVRYVRGCEFRAGACVDRGDGQKLWDIFHSNPVVVGPPNAALREKTYREFVTKYKHRKRVIYAGSNGGFVHGFNTGEYDTAEAPGAYDRGTGAEEFGFMAYPARQNIAELPKDTAPRSYYYMDGSPSAADVWFPTGLKTDPDDEYGDWDDWHTVLIGGMRQGGRAVWALDVTNPNGEEPAGPVYPGYLWEFPCERSACDAWRPYMGETWSQPVITRVKATVECGDENGWSGCGTYDRWVAIFGAGYDASGDPNMPHDTDGTVVAGEYDPGTDADTKLAGRALFMVDVATGEVLGAKRFEYDGTAGDPTDGEPRMQYAIASEPAVFDLDFDGYADAVYVGDLGGNLWKWVIHPPAEDHILGSSGDDHQGRWKFLKILTAESCTSCSPKHYKSFFYPPTGAVLGQHLWLALGSGERNDLDYG
ncbi:MAG: pilus assembly protein, partial [Planctomycetota bacterium]